MSKYLFKISSENSEMMLHRCFSSFFMVDFKEAFAQGMLRGIRKVRAFRSGEEGREVELLEKRMYVS